MTPASLALLLALPPRTRPVPHSVSVERSEGYDIETLELEIGGAPVRGLLTRPSDILPPLPAILYCHAHGGCYEIGASELIDGRPSLLGAYGPALARAGFVTLSIDMPTFGQRQEPGESALAKTMLWQGKTLMGAMLGDLLAAFDYLAGRPDVDPLRIAAFGLSMGATHTYFLGALEPGLNRIAHLCCYADWATLAETGAHDLHGHYMTIPGLLAKTSVGVIAGLTAPRPQLICVGEDDPLTPPAAVSRAHEETLVAYRRAGVPDALTLISIPGIGHSETSSMREAVLRFLGAMRG